MDAPFYCDESGYTGTDWSNPDQRVSVHGGWLILNSERHAIALASMISGGATNSAQENSSGGKSRAAQIQPSARSNLNFICLPSLRKSRA